MGICRYLDYLLDAVVDDECDEYELADHDEVVERGDVADELGRGERVARYDAARRRKLGDQSVVQNKSDAILVMGNVHKIGQQQHKRREQIRLAFLIWQNRLMLAL